MRMVLENILEVKSGCGTVSSTVGLDNCEEVGDFGMKIQSKKEVIFYILDFNVSQSNRKYHL